MDKTSLATERPEHYRLDGPSVDEAFDRAGRVRPQYAAIVEQLAHTDLHALRQQANAFVEAAGVRFGGSAGGHSFKVDPVPRVVEAGEWESIEAGIAQRIEALNRFTLDVYGDQQIVDRGIVAREAIEAAEYFEPDLVGFVPPGGVFANIGGFDLVRDSGGDLRVLEDNLRSPSGIAFAVAARRMSDATLELGGESPKLSATDSYRLLGEALRAAAPEACGGDPSIVLLSDGPESGAWYEHEQLAGELAIDLVTLDQLELHGGAVLRRTDRRLEPVDVIYRRTQQERLRGPAGELTDLGELLLGPLRRGTVATVNAFGSGVADDKLIQSYVEAMIEFYLGEQPLLRSVPTYDPGSGENRVEIVGRIADLVIKPRGGLGGTGVMIGPKANEAQRAAMRDRIEADPHGWVAQETVALSTHPTVVGDRLEPRHVDLRPYAVMLASGPSLLPAALTRVALERDQMIVNSSSNGGAKDTWVIAR